MNFRARYAEVLTHSLPPALLAVLVLLLAAMMATGLPQLTPDSLGYFGAAERLARGDGFGDGFLWWPPLYPLLLALPVATGVMPGVAAAGLNGLAFMLLGLLLWRLTARAISSSVLRLVVVSLCLLGSPVALVYDHAWSEALFLPCSIGALLCWSRVLDGDDCVRWRLAGSALTAGALASRHVGLSLFVAIGLCLVLTPRLDWRRRLRAGCWLGLAGLPYLLWLYRTWGLSGQLAGPRPPAQVGFAENLGRLVDTMAHWVIPHAYFHGDGLAWLAGVLGIALGGVACALRGARGDRQPLPGGAFWLAAVFVLCYAAMLLASASRYAMDPIGDRLLAPAFLVLVFMGGVVADRVAARLRMQPPTLQARALQSLAALWLLQWWLAPNALVSLLL